MLMVKSPCVFFNFIVLVLAKIDYVDSYCILIIKNNTK